MSERNIWPRLEIMSKLSQHPKRLVQDDMFIDETDPYTLLNHYRFDLPAKYIYAKFRELGLKSNWGEKLYDEHLRIWNGYVEGDDSGKIGKQAFVNAFDHVLDSIKNSGFDEQKSIVPIGTDNSLIDGAHRLTASLLYNKKIKSVKLNHQPPNYDYNFFRTIGLSEKWCDAIALEYCRLKKETYIVVVFPSAIGEDEKIKKTLNEYGTIYYEKTVTLNKQGSINLIKQLYLGEDWLGDWNNNFSGARDKANACFNNNGPVRIYVFETSSYQNTRLAKEQIRNHFKIGNHSIHINDNHEETVHLAQLFFNSNSIHFLNNAKLNDISNSFYLDFEKFKSYLCERGLVQEHCCVVSGSVMGIYGIRKPGDIDFLIYGTDLLSNNNPIFHNDEKDLQYTLKTKDDIIFNPENHFYFEGIKFASIDTIVEMKRNRNEPKDINDISLIDSFFNHN